jgi:hypothetical protein
VTSNRLTTRTFAARLACRWVSVAAIPLSALLAPASAGADEVYGTAHAVASGPLLAGDRVTWAEFDRALVSDARSYGFTVRIATAAGAATLGTVRTNTTYDPVLGASPDLVAAGRFASDRYGLYSSPVLSWTPADGAGAQFGDCRPPTLVLGLIDVSGTEVATCDNTSSPVAVYDGRSGALTDRPGARSFAGVRIAGRLVAWLESLDVHRYTLVVFDRDQRRDVLRLDTAALGATLSDWDLQADGTVAYVADGLVGWTSPAEPIGHRLPLRRDASYRLRLTDGVLAFRRGRKRDGTLGVLPLGGTATIVARGIGEGFDADATRVTFVVNGCERDTVVVRERTSAPYTARTPSCPLRLTRPPTLTRDTRRLATTVACSAFPGYCNGDAALTRPDARHGPTVLARGWIRDGIAHLPIRKAARKLLRDRRVLHARLSVAFYSGPHETVTRSRAIVITPP